MSDTAAARRLSERSPPLRRLLRGRSHRGTPEPCWVTILAQGPPRSIGPLPKCLLVATATALKPNPCDVRRRRPTNYRSASLVEARPSVLLWSWPWCSLRCRCCVFGGQRPLEFNGTTRGKPGLQSAGGKCRGRADPSDQHADPRARAVTYRHINNTGPSRPATRKDAGAGDAGRDGGRWDGSFPFPLPSAFFSFPFPVPQLPSGCRSRFPRRRSESLGQIEACSELSSRRGLHRGA